MVGCACACGTRHACGSVTGTEMPYRPNMPLSRCASCGRQVELGWVCLLVRSRAVDCDLSSFVLLFRAVSSFSIKEQWDCARKRLRGIDTAKANGTCRGYLLNTQRVRCSNHPLELTYFRQANKSDLAISYIMPRSIVVLLQCEEQCCSSH